jgi:uncharacterized protein (DUF433 family)
MIDWSGCNQVVVRAGYLSGAPALRADPRVPPETIVENMDAGESAEDVIWNFGLRTSVANALAIYDFARRQLAHITAT